MLGKSLTEHITDLITNSLSDNDIQETNLFSVDKFKDIEERLLSLESIVSNQNT